MYVIIQVCHIVQERIIYLCERGRIVLERGPHGDWLGPKQVHGRMELGERSLPLAVCSYLTNKDVNKKKMAF